MRVEESVALSLLLFVNFQQVLSQSSPFAGDTVNSFLDPYPNRTTPVFDTTKIELPNNASLPYNASEEVVLDLYTRRNPIFGEKIKLDTQWLARTTFNKAHKTVFVIHGWMSSQFTPSIKAIREGYLKRGNFNVIMVDWSPGAMTGQYSIVRYRINDTAVVIAKAINFLIAKNLINYKNVTIVGHSLGGQMAGLTAKLVTGGKLGFIVALDPAGPLFNNGMMSGILSKNDADYVEVIHTSIRGVGYAEPLGHSDFYPNFGYNQIGCPYDYTGLCSHFRSTRFFAESLNNNQFHAVECASFDEINQNRCTVQSSGYLMGGEPLNTSVTGVFYLPTNANPPYAVPKGQASVIQTAVGTLTNFIEGFIIFNLTFKRAIILGLIEAFKMYSQKKP